MKPKTAKRTGASITATDFIDALAILKAPKKLEKVKRFFHDKEKTKFLGVRMGDIFKLAKDAKDMSTKELENLLKSEFFEARMDAVSIMDFKARDKKPVLVC